MEACCTSLRFENGCCETESWNGYWETLRAAATGAQEVKYFFRRRLKDQNVVDDDDGGGAGNSGQGHRDCSYSFLETSPVNRHLFAR